MDALHTIEVMHVAGFIGYVLLGLYFRKFVDELSWKKIRIHFFLGTPSTAVFIKNKVKKRLIQKVR